MSSEIAWQAVFASVVIAMDISFALAGCDSHKHRHQAKDSTAQTTLSTSALPKHCGELNDSWVVFSGESERYPALTDLRTANIASSQPFTFTVRICGDATQQPDRLTADATMPAHKHGMNYQPGVTRKPESGAGFVDYQITNFVFHMPGVWEIKLVAYRDEAITEYTHTIELK